MRMDNIACYLALSLLASYSLCASTAPVYSVLQYGAIGDGKKKDTNAFIEAWNATCEDPRAPTLWLPSGKTFLLGLVSFEGPCKSKIHIQIDGYIVAPSYIWSGEDMDHWINFRNINGLTIDGSGVIDGQGSIWWPCQDGNKQCPQIPDSMGFQGCEDLTLTGLRFVDSPGKHVSIGNTVGVHVSIGNTVGVHVSKLEIKAPGDSPNTDGIHVEQSQHVTISHSIIGTGDDCISIGDGIYDLNIYGIICGPGHGISVGSLGKSGSDVNVEGIHVSNCTIINTTNGVRIKTWQGGSGYAKRITFENIKFTAVDRPIVIDQFYCDKNGHHCANKTSAVQINDVQYTNIAGTSAYIMAVSLNCSQTIGCSGIIADNVVVTSAVEGEETRAFCSNARGSKGENVVPDIPCLK